MDSLCLYKGKLDDALTLVPIMCQENKLQAVDYWNVVARRMEALVNDHVGPNFNQPNPNLTPSPSSSSSPSASLSSSSSSSSSTATPPSSLGSNLPVSPAIDGHINPSGYNTTNLINVNSIHTDSSHVITTNLSSSTNSRDSILVTPTIKQTSFSHFHHHQEPPLNKTIYDTSYLEHSPVNVIDDSEQLQQLHHSPTTMIESEARPVSMEGVTDTTTLAAGYTITSTRQQQLNPTTTTCSSHPTIATTTTSKTSNVILTPSLSSSTSSVATATSSKTTTTSLSSSTIRDTQDLSMNSFNNFLSKQSTMMTSASVPSSVASHQHESSSKTIVAPVGSTLDGGRVVVVDSYSSSNNLEVPQPMIHSAGGFISNKGTTSTSTSTNNSITTSTSVNDNKIEQHSSMTVGAGYTETLAINSLGCPRTTNITDDIGNGQFDRGPKEFADKASILEEMEDDGNSDDEDEDDAEARRLLAEFLPDSETISRNQQPMNTPHALLAAAAARNDLFTHSDRPLQPIQFAIEPSNGGDYLNLASNSHYSINSNNNHTRMPMKYIFNGSGGGGGGGGGAVGTEQQDDHHAGGLHNHNNHHHNHQQYFHLQQIHPMQSIQGSSSSSSPEGLSDRGNQLIMDLANHHLKGTSKNDAISSAATTSNNLTTTTTTSTTAITTTNNINNNNNNSQHTCDVCGKSGFSTKGNLKRHLRAHSGEKPFKCEFCDSCFTEKKSLKIHVRRHTGEKPYKCEVCGKLFSQTGVLQSHMALHLNERKFECNKCGKAFRQRSQLKLHLMRHEGVKRLECSTCRARFLTKGDLERHCRIHTGERPYACNMCEKTFTRQQSLNEHMNRHTGKRPYDCKYCDKTFSEMSACYKHAKTHKKQEQQLIHQNNNNRSNNSSSCNNNQIQINNTC